MLFSCRAVRTPTELALRCVSADPSSYPGCESLMPHLLPWVCLCKRCIDARVVSRVLECLYRFLSLSSKHVSRVQSIVFKYYRTTKSYSLFGDRSRDYALLIESALRAFELSSEDDEEEPRSAGASLLPVRG
jgi:hypothetical protein